ncbi:hypothetical protein [Nostoc edaphicum]|nr:hypothetical protein [Nostoc edaphicum]
MQNSEFRIQNQDARDALRPWRLPLGEDSLAAGAIRQSYIIHSEF